MNQPHSIWLEEISPNPKRLNIDCRRLILVYWTFKVTVGPVTVTWCGINASKGIACQTSSPSVYGLGHLPVQRSSIACLASSLSVYGLSHLPVDHSTLAGMGLQHSLWCGLTLYLNYCMLLDFQGDSGSRRYCRRLMGHVCDQQVHVPWRLPLPNAHAPFQSCHTLAMNWQSVRCLLDFQGDSGSRQGHTVEPLYGILPLLINKYGANNEHARMF